MRNFIKDPRFWLLLGLTVLMAVLQFGGWIPDWRYQRLEITDGQWWRIFSCNFIHLNAAHLGMNLAGLWLLYLFFEQEITFKNWLSLLLVGALGVGGGIYYLSPEVSWYVGLSGVLHGIVIFGALRALRTIPIMASLVLCLMIGRLIWEQTPDYDVNYLRDTIGGAVLVNAHLYGAVTGALLAGVNGLFGKLRVQGTETLQQ